MTIPGGYLVHYPCIFPFNFGGVKNITSCIFTDELEHPWCPTKTHDNGDTVSGYWGNCKESCPGMI